MSATPRQGLAALHHTWTDRPNITDLTLERSRLTATTTAGDTVILERFGADYFGKRIRPTSTGEYQITSRKFDGPGGIVDATAWAEGHLGTDQ